MSSTREKWYHFGEKHKQGCSHRLFPSDEITAFLMGPFIWLAKRSLTSVSLVFLLLGVWRRPLPLLLLLLLFLWLFLVLLQYPFGLHFHLFSPTHRITKQTLIPNIKKPIIRVFVIRLTESSLALQTDEGVSCILLRSLLEHSVTLKILTYCKKPWPEIINDRLSQITVIFVRISIYINLKATYIKYFMYNHSLGLIRSFNRHQS